MHFRDHPVRNTSGYGESESNTSSLGQKWRSTLEHPPTRALLARDSKAFLHQAASTPCLNAIARAEGAYIWDMAGNRYLDFHGNNVHHIGYGHPRLKAAVRAQMDALPYAPRRFTCEPAVALAEKLARISPEGLSKVLFATGGSDAIEIALKYARAVTGRFKTLSFWDAYHGSGFGASSVGGEALFRSHIAGPLLPGAEHIAPFACYRCPYGHDDNDGMPVLEVCKMACANMVRYVLEREGDVAAMVAEPARATPYIPPAGFWHSVKDACNDYGTLLIFDEIPTGLGKTGRMFACDHDDVVPDILVLGKALGGGMLPISAVIMRPEYDIAGEFALGHYTHEKNPVTARAALTTIDIIEKEGLVANAATEGDYLMERLQDLKRRFSMIGDVRGRGLLLGIEIVQDRTDKVPDNLAAEEILYRCLNQGLSFKISLGNVLTWTPPLLITREDSDFAIATLQAVLETINHASRSR